MATSTVMIGSIQTNQTMKKATMVVISQMTATKTVMTTTKAVTAAMKAVMKAMQATMAMRTAAASAAADVCMYACVGINLCM